MAQNNSKNAATTAKQQSVAGVALQEPTTTPINQGN